MKNDKHVYFMKPVDEHGPIKIGCSSEPVKRLRALEIVSPVLLEVICSAPGSHGHENWLHHRFSKDRRHGEWFEWSQDLQIIIDHVANTGNLPPMEIPKTSKQLKERVAFKIGRMPRRNPKVTPIKFKITAAVHKAERRVYGFGGDKLFRPDEIDAILDDQRGFWADPISGKKLALIDKYIATLNTLPEKPRDMSAWTLWANQIREQAA